VLFKIKESYDLATGQLSDNAYAWNKQGHVLYIDQPKYVGNSFGSGLGCKSSVEAANDIVTFLQGWYDEFPEFAANKVVISGESYGKV
jgi:carboxypeptidase C (cathepsin A)